VSGLPSIASVSAGVYHSLALGGDGTVWAWGDNQDGQIGDGAAVDFTVPVVALPLLATVPPLPDYDSDGKPDVLWRNYTTGEMTTWYMNGTAKSAEAALTTLADTNWVSVASGDFNADGKPDILWRNFSTGANAVWFMDDAMYLSDASLLPVPDLKWKIAGIGDFNRDGQPDIVWRNYETGANMLWFMDGVNKRSEVSLPAMADVNWKLVAVGDLNEDWLPDFLWRNRATGQNLVWLMSGVANLSSAYLPTVSDQNWRIVGIGDFNADSRNDVLWRNTSTGENKVWLMYGTTMARELSLPSQGTAWATGAEPPNRAPIVVGANPGTGTTASQTFAFTVSDADGWQDLGVVNVLVNSALDGRHACYLAYARSINVLYLVNDAGTALLPGLLVNGTGSLSNSQCTITNPTVSGTGNTMTLTMNMSFPTTFAGYKVFYMAVRDSLENNSGWQPVASWAVPPMTTTSPRVTGMTPGRGSGTSGQVTFQFSDSHGWQNLGVVNMLLNTALDGRHACYMAYARTINVLYLVNDAGDGLLPGLVVNGTGSLSNSQCTITNPTVSGSGNTMTLQMNIAYGASFNGNRIWYLAARDVLENNSGWQAAGTWPAP